MSTKNEYQHEDKADQVFENRLLEALECEGEQDEIITAMFTGDVGAMDMFEEALWHENDVEDLEDEKYLPIKFKVTGTKWQVSLLSSLLSGSFDGDVNVEILKNE